MNTKSILFAVFGVILLAVALMAGASILEWRAERNEIVARIDELNTSRTKRAEIDEAYVSASSDVIKSLNDLEATISEARKGLEEFRCAETLEMLRVLFGNQTFSQLKNYGDAFNEIVAILENPELWPKAEADVLELQNKTREVINAMPPLMQDAFLAKLAPIRWSLDAFSVLRDNSENFSDLLERAKDLLDYVPPGAPQVLVEDLKGTTSELENTLRSSALDDARSAILAGTHDSRESAWISLLEWDEDERVLELRASLESLLRIGHFRESLSELHDQALRADSLPDHVTRKLAITQLYESVMAIQLHAHASEFGDEALDEIRLLRMKIESSLLELTEDEQERLAKLRRDYQGWTLRQIRQFEYNFDLRTETAAKLLELSKKEDAPAESFRRYKSVEDLLLNSGVVIIKPPTEKLVGIAYDYLKDKWTDKKMKEEFEFLIVRDLMVEFLLPVEEGLLEPPVRRIYEKTFEIGWNNLEKRDEDRVYIARQTVHVKKKPLTEMRLEAD